MKLGNFKCLDSRWNGIISFAGRPKVFGAVYCRVIQRVLEPFALKEQLRLVLALRFGRLLFTSVITLLLLLLFLGLLPLVLGRPGPFGNGRGGGIFLEGRCRGTDQLYLRLRGL